MAKSIIHYSISPCLVLLKVQVKFSLKQEKTCSETATSKLRVAYINSQKMTLNLDEYDPCKTLKYSIPLLEKPTL